MAGVKGQQSGGNRSKPLAVHDLEGTRNVTRHSGYRNPEPPDGDPVQPKPLTGDAAEQWDRVVEALRRQGTLQQNTAFAIYNHCQVWALAERWQEAVDALDWPTYDKCRLVKDSKGKVTSHMEPAAEPAFDKLKVARDAVDKTLKTLGLTPDSIGRVRIPTGSDVKKQSPLATLQAGTAIRRVK